MKLMEIWVKAPQLRGADLLIAGECVTKVAPKALEQLSKNKVVLTACPEAEGSYPAGKLASILRASKPRSVAVLTVEGSPHCYTLHASLNEAIFITGLYEVKVQHFVVHEGQVYEVSSKAVRVSRYLHLVEKLCKRFPEIEEELTQYSLEHRFQKEAERR